jgi:positive regulator of sigma E activity
VSKNVELIVSFVALIIGVADFYLDHQYRNKWSKATMVEPMMIVVLMVGAYNPRVKMDRKLWR